MTVWGRGSGYVRSACVLTLRARRRRLGRLARRYHRLRDQKQIRGGVSESPMVASAAAGMGRGAEDADGGEGGRPREARAHHLGLGRSLGDRRRANRTARGRLRSWDERELVLAAVLLCQAQGRQGEMTLPASLASASRRTAEKM